MRHISHKSLSPLNPHTPQARKTATSTRQAEKYQRLFKERELDAAIADAPVFTAIRNGRIVEVSWNDLTEAEHRAAYNNVFYSCDLEVC